MNAKFSPIPDTTYCGRETVGDVVCDVICSPAESFDGEPVLTYLAIPTAASMDMDCAIHAKDVPMGTPAASVSWDDFLVVLEC